MFLLRYFKNKAYLDNIKKFINIYRFNYPLYIVILY